MFASMLKYYGGGITYTELQNMPYRQFLMYHDYMLHLQRWETEEGRKINDMLDRGDKRKFKTK